VRESPALEQAYQRFREKGVVVVGVFVQDTERNARSFSKGMGLTFPVGLDADSQIARGFRFIGMPLTIFVGKDGAIAKRVAGPLPEEDLIKEIQQLLEQGG